MKQTKQVYAAVLSQKILFGRKRYRSLDSSGCPEVHADGGLGDLQVGQTAEVLQHTSKHGSERSTQEGPGTEECVRASEEQAALPAPPSADVFYINPRQNRALKRCSCRTPTGQTNIYVPMTHLMRGTASYVPLLTPATVVMSLTYKLNKSGLDSDPQSTLGMIQSFTTNHKRRQKHLVKLLIITLNHHVHTANTPSLSVVLLHTVHFLILLCFL